MGMTVMVCEECGATEEVSSTDLPLECSECGSTDFSPTDDGPPLP